MLILGLLLLVLSVAAAVVLIASNTGGAQQTVSLFGQDLTQVTLMEAFLSGIVLTLLFALGLWMITQAGRRARANRVKYRDARREAKAAAAERDQLAERVRQEEEARAEQDTSAHPMQPGQAGTAAQPVDPATGRPVAGPGGQPGDRRPR